MVGVRYCGSVFTFAMLSDCCSMASWIAALSASRTLGEKGGENRDKGVRVLFIYLGITIFGVLGNFLIFWFSRV